MRYLVTGGAGFIGSHLVEHLAKSGAEVVVLDDLSTGKRSNLTELDVPHDLVVGSVTDQALCTELMDGVDYVLHQAALPSVPRSVRDPKATHDVNASGTLSILQAARDAGVRRVVMASSSSVYGNAAALPKREDMTIAPLSPYAASKAAAECYGRAFHAVYGLETVMLRYFNVFGPRQDPASQYAAAVPRFVTAALQGEVPVIFGDGQQTRDFTFVENVVHANLLACESSPEVSGQVINVGCGRRVSVQQLWDAIAGIVGTDIRPRHVRERPGDVRDSLASLECAHRFLTYEPVVGLEEGLRRTVESMQSAGRDELLSATG